MLAIKDRIAFDILDTWQARCVVAATGKTAAVLMSALCHSFDEGVPILYELVFPQHGPVPAPYLESVGRIDKTGAVVAKVREQNGLVKEKALYRNEIELRDDFRKLADRLKLCDRDRVEMFSVVIRWVVADRRLDPTMDPKDPDAKRLVD